MSRPEAVPSGSSGSADMTLNTARLLLSTPRADLADSMCDFVRRNHSHLAPWNPPAPAGVETPVYWQEVVVKSAAAFAVGSAVRFWLRLREDPQRVIGSAGFSQIARGPFCAGVLGYQIDRDCQGKGLMGEALQAAITYMFEAQKLHRIGANYRPENVRSGRLLASLGFRIEGYAKDYLFIDGGWRDHILTSLTNPTFESGWIKMG